MQVKKAPKHPTENQIQGVLHLILQEICVWINWIPQEIPPVVLSLIHSDLQSHRKVLIQVTSFITLSLMGVKNEVISSFTWNTIFLSRLFDCLTTSLVSSFLSTRQLKSQDVSFFLFVLNIKRSHYYFSCYSPSSW